MSITGHPLAGRCQASKEVPGGASRHCSIGPSSRLQLPITPVSSNRGCDESRQTPIRIKRTTILLPVALAAWPPQKNVGAATCPMGSSQTRGCRVVGANPLVARVAGDPLSLQTGDGGTASHSDQMAVSHSSPQIRACRPPS